MAYNEQQLLPFDLIKTELLGLCTDGQSGDLCLFTEEKHAAVISIHQGDIVGLRYRIARGTEALKLIKGIGKAKIRFEENNSRTIDSEPQNIPSTNEILELLKTRVDAGAAQNATKVIMVVEDSRTQRKIICRMLNQNGYITKEASNGHEAIESLNYVKPDLILLDIVMPGIDGYKVMSIIKEKPDMENIPIIMLTSRDSLIDKMRSKVSGTDEYLTKPFKYETLINVVDKYLFVDSNNYIEST